MARLPQPGGDSGNWGTILNDYLSQSHKADGTLKDDSVSSSSIQDNSITEALLSSAVQTKLNTSPTIADNSITYQKLETAAQNKLANLASNANSTYAPVPIAARNPLTGWWHVDGYGAKGDGTTDDKNAINNAIVACAAAGGGTVYIPPTQQYYSLSGPLTPRSKVTVLSHQARIRLTTDNPAFYASTISFNDFTVDGLVFEGPVTESPTAPQRSRTTGTGMVSAISTQGDLDPSGTGASLKNFIMRNCVVRNCKGLPILIKGVRGSIQVVNNQFINNLDVGFTHCESVMFNSNYIYGSADNGVSLSRVNTKMTCVGNVIENCAYEGIWVAGFIGDKGPTNVAITGNTIKNVGKSGIHLDAAPKYGTVVGNSIDQGYFHGPSDEPTDGGCVGILIGGFPTTDRATPTDWASDWVISSNQIRRAPRAGILCMGVRRTIIIGNQISDIGTPFLADGTTSVSVASSSHNVGILFDYPTTSSDVTVTNNKISDSRSTPYTNWAIVPVGSSAVNEYFNEMVNCRNTYNLIETGPLRNINWVPIFQNNTRHTLGATAGASATTGTIAAFDINGAAGSVRMDRVKTAASDRWSWGANGTAESGSNAGSDFELRAYNDAGAFLGTAITAKRSNFTVSAGKGFVQATKAGAPLDSDFATTPSDGTTVLDTANNRLYVRSSGAWRYTTLT